MYSVLFSILLGSILFSKASFAQTCEENRITAITNYSSTCMSHAGCYEGGTGTVCTSPEVVTESDLNQSYLVCVLHSTTAGIQNPDGYLGGIAVALCPNSPKPPESSYEDSPQNACAKPATVGLSGSIVKTETQTLGEEVELAGVPFGLYYHSAFQEGYLVNRQIKMQITSGTPSTIQQNYGVSVWFIPQAGTQPVLADSEQFQSTNPSQQYVYQWNGLNEVGQPVSSYNFEVISAEYFPAPTPSLRTKYLIKLFHFNAKKIGLGGWLPSVMKAADFRISKMFYADGSAVDILKRFGDGPGRFQVPDPSGEVVYVFDQDGKHLSTKTGLLGTVVQSFTYTSSGKLSSITDAFGNSTIFNRNINGELTSITAPNGQVTQITLDVNGYVSSITNPTNEAHAITYYASNGLMHTFQKPNGEVSSFQYDADGLLTQDNHSGGYFFQIFKNLNSNVKIDMSVTTSMGRTKAIRTTVNSTTVERNVTDWDGTTSSSYFADYSTNYNKIERSRGFTHSWSLRDDKRFGKMVKFPNYYSVNNSLTSRTWEYSDSLTQADVDDPFSITSLSMIEQLSGASAKIITTFDPVLKKFSSSSFLGKTSEVTIDQYERPVVIKSGNLQSTSLGYTGDKLSSVSVGSRTTSIAYNAEGLISSVTNPLMQTTGFVYDSANRLTSTVYPDSRTVNYNYDGAGNLTGVTPFLRPLHSFVVNGHGLVGSYNPPTLTGVATVGTSYVYNLDKELTKITRPDGKYLDYIYNSSSSVLEWINTSDGNYQYTWHASGNPSFIRTPSGGMTYINYIGDKISNLVTYDGSWNVLANYNASYGAQDLFNSDTVNSAGVASTINYLYNEDEDLSKAGDLFLNYNIPDGQLTGTSLGTGSTGFTDSYTYNTYGEVTGYQMKRGSSVIYNLVLARDASGRINSKTQTMNSVTNAYAYNFDSSGRLDQVTKNSVVVSNYGYDSNSNRISGNIGAQTTAATYDDQDRLTAYNTFNFTYNANGELLTKTNTLTNQTTQYSYDVFGNLTKVILPNGTVIDYEIDGLNRRIGKKVNGVLQKRWVWMDQYRIAAELKATGEIYRRFVYGSKSNVPDYMITPTNTYRIVSDQLGSVRLIMSPTGSVVQRMDHDEFGRVIEDTVPAVTPFGFAGGMYDNQTGLVRFGARDYDPETGRWTTKDPIGFGGGDSNLYGYVENDPVNWIDYNGLNKNKPGNTIDNNTIGGGGGGSGGAVTAGGAALLLKILKPNGKWIGERGSDWSKRVLKGGVKEAKEMFKALCEGGKSMPKKGLNGKYVEHTDGTTVVFRQTSKSGPPTIDVNIGKDLYIKIKFVGE